MKTTNQLMISAVIACVSACAASNSVPAPEAPSLPPAPAANAAENSNVEIPAERAAPQPPVAEPAQPVEQAPAAAAGNDCKSDADCVPSSCCHSTSCVAKGSAPDCHHQMCTQECRPATLDCGGHCLCQNGKCAAQLAGQAPAL